MELDEIRKEIDALDGQLVELLCRRMDCSLQVAAYKAAHRLPVLNREREEQVLAGVRRDAAALDREGAGFPEAAAVVFSTMMDVSRALQHRRLAAGQSLRQAIEAARVESAGEDGTPRVACAGCAGAYADEAAGILYPTCRRAESRPLFVPAFGDVVKAVLSGEADVGILPVENSSTGSVNEVYDLIMAARLSIVGAVELPVRHCLLALPGARPEGLRAVYSHHQGLSQCADYIAAHRLEPRQFSNTAAAARMVAESGDPTACAIASRHAAEIYGLQIVEENIQSVSNNSTRFIALSRRLRLPPDADKVSLIFTIPNVTGSLYKTLARFAMEGLNLTKIESRPVRSGDFDYVFYLDFEGNLGHPGTVDLLCALSEELPVFHFMGNYREIRA